MYVIYYSASHTLLYTILALYTMHYRWRDKEGRTHFPKLYQMILWMNMVVGVNLYGGYVPMCLIEKKWMMKKIRMTDSHGGMVGCMHGRMGHII